MRLLDRKNDSEFSLTKDFVSDDIPRYAILSHTWGVDTEEVTFRDLMDGTGKNKAGYNKIRFCAEQARRDGLQYFWVDTCCIDKSNSTELAEAINSMFRWYRDATKCYVYLSDVSITKRKASNQLSDFTWESAFRASKWFTRGWTLQELLAPASVEFFSREGRRLGDKSSLERQVHEITGIAVLALQGGSLSYFGVNERLSWAEHRETTRKEDKAYSLLGIFDIYIPLIYGEGRDNAFIRLRNEIDKPSKGLDRLPYAVEAPFNSYAKQQSPSCLPNTRVELLRDVHIWADRHDEHCIFWLNGLAGTGKSTIARTIARRYSDQKRLGASFFFSRGGGDVGHAGKFVTSIAVQLAKSIPALRRYISDAAADYSDIANRSLRDQWQLLVFGPLSKLDSNSCRASYVLVVDALDECDDKDNIRILLQLLTEARSLKTVQLRVFLTSRPDVPIRHGFYQMSETEHCDFVLHNISPSIIDHDIKIFLEYNLRLIGEEDAQDASWPGTEVINTLVQSSSGLFIWAATACRFIRDGLFSDERLLTLLNGNASNAATPEDHLNGIYITVLQNSVQANFSQQDKERFCSMLRDILGSVVALFSPLSINSLSRLLFTPKQRVDRILKDFHAILDIPKDPIRPFRLHHPSFRDFLLDKNRCGDPNFWVDERQVHQALAESCVRLMSTSLKQDICGLDAPGVLVAEVESSRVEQCLPPEVQYACLYWVEHLQKGDARLRDNDKVHQFLQTHLLHWLEALSWMQKMSEGILAIISLDSIALIGDCPRLYAFIYDIKRFGLYFHSIIEQAPLQLYSSALIFAPEMSAVRLQFEYKIPCWVQKLPLVPKNWSRAISTLEGHSSSVTTVAFPPDGKQLASASEDGTVRLWDTATGASLSTLQGHSKDVTLVTFLLDGKQLVSASADGTVRLWDATTGAAISTFCGHLKCINAVVPSQDGKLLASASEDTTIKLWDVAIGEALATLEGHSGDVNAVVFSPDGKLLASASDDTTVKLWDVATGEVLETLEDHDGEVFSIAFSPDGKLLASASDDTTIKLWDVATGEVLETLEDHDNIVFRVAFSPDGKLLASASADETVRLWDGATGSALLTLEGQFAFESTLSILAFSPDGKQLVSAPDDGTIWRWDLTTGAAISVFEGHASFVSAVAFSPDGKQLASASADRTVRLWDLKPRENTPMIEGYSDSAWKMIFSPDRKQIASLWLDHSIRLWDAASGAALSVLKGHCDWVRAVAFSLDSALLASASSDNTINLWEVATGEALQILKGHLDSVWDVAFSPNGKYIVSVSHDKTAKLWDTATGMTLTTLKGHLSPLSNVAFSPNSKQLVSASYYEPAKIWDVATGEGLQTLVGHNDGIGTVVFSPDSKLLATVSSDNTIKLWDAATGTALQTLAGQFHMDQPVAFSPDGKQLATSSYHTKNVELWATATGTVLHTMKVDTFVESISFSSDGSCLETNNGLLDIVSLPSGIMSLAFSHGIFMKDQWIARGTDNILWVPPDYRPRHAAVNGNVVFLRHGTDCASIIEFVVK